MTQINPNMNPYNQRYGQVNPQVQRVDVPAPQRMPQQPQVRIPSYYVVSDNANAQSFSEILKSSPVYDLVLKPIVEHPIATALSWIGISVGIDAYAQACRGDYDKSVVKRAANLGDNIEQSKFVQSKPVQAVLDVFRGAKKQGGKLVEHSAILRAMKDTPTMPEWSMAKAQMYNQKQEIVQDFVRIADALKLGEPDAIKLKNIGITKAEKEAVIKDFKVSKFSEIPEEKAVNQVLLKRLGRTPAEINKIQGLGNSSTEAVKKEILKELGLAKTDITAIKEDVYGKTLKQVEAAMKRAGSKVKMGTGHYGWMGPLTKPFERTIGCDEVYNKLHSLGDGAKTATGRFVSKAMQMFHRGITFGGGKLGALIFIAPMLVEVGANVKKADKDQKIGTAVGGLIESTSWVLTFPLALRMMHALGGVKYAGMGKDKVEQYRKVLNDFNTKTKAGAFADKEAYNVAKNKAKEQLKKLSKVDGQNILTKGIRKLGHFLTLDLETFKGYKSSNIVMNKIRQIPNFFKNVLGVPMRFGVWGLISMGVLGAAITKCTTAIFGKSYDAMKQEEHEDAKKAQKEFLKEDLNKRLYEAAMTKAGIPVQQEAAQLSQKQAGQAYASRGLNKYSNLTPQPTQEEKVDNYTYIPSSKNVIPSPKTSGKADNYSYIPSSECTIPSDKTAENDEKQRRYIPSQAAANIQKTYDNSGMQSVLYKAQRAEDKALRVLAGNFDGM